MGSGVDLNSIRVGVAATPEASDFTSVQARIDDRQSAAEVSTIDAQDVRTENGENAGWLSPVALAPPRKTVRATQTTRRASSRGCLFELVVYPEHANFPVRKRPSLVEIGGDWSAVQIDRLVTGSCRQILDAPAGSTDASKEFDFGLVIERATALRSNQRNSPFGWRSTEIKKP